MAKRTENDENLKRYQERIAQLQKEGGLVPSPKLPLDKLIQYLAGEGTKLLNTITISTNSTKSQSKTDETKLIETLGLTSKNPYVRARIQTLMTWTKDPKTAWKAKEIEDMESGKLPQNKHYDEFVKIVAELGDSLSNKK